MKFGLYVVNDFYSKLLKVDEVRWMLEVKGLSV